VVGFTPAGTTDIAARILAERLTQRLGQSVLVENRPGAGGNLGAEVVSKAEPDGQGATLWDRSLIYVATDFGREKIRPANASAFGTGHHLNNGVVMVSPLLRGNRVYGGIDPTTLLTHGFDPTTGDAAPGTVMREGDVYAVVAGALGVDYPGRRSFPSMIRG
jgi:hypothetical protein